MKILTFLLGSFFFSLSLIGQDEVIVLESFNRLSAAGGFYITIYEGTPKAEITVHRGKFENIQMEVRKGELEIKYNQGKWGWNSGNHKIDIDLYVTNLEAISTAAGTSVYGEFTLSAPEFTADASSGSSISVEVMADEVEVDISSGATVELEGNTKELSVDISSGASFNGKKLEASIVDADASSGASAKVWATKSLSADVSSGASIKYRGEPKELDLDSGKWSGGSIRKM